MTAPRSTRISITKAGETYVEAVALAESVRMAYRALDQVLDRLARWDEARGMRHAAGSVHAARHLLRSAIELVSSEMAGVGR